MKFVALFKVVFRWNFAQIFSNIRTKICEYLNIIRILEMATNQVWILIFVRKYSNIWIYSNICCNTTPDINYSCQPASLLHFYSSWLKLIFSVNWLVLSLHQLSWFSISSTFILFKVCRLEAQICIWNV